MKQNDTKDVKEIYFAGGCFWGTEKYLSGITGVVETDVGYANGKTENPTYEEVCRHGTGHAETVRVRYDKNQLRLEFLLNLFYDVIDPTAVNRQGADIGTQYRTGIYYVDEEDKEAIAASVRELQNKFNKPVVIEVLKLQNYYPAETYHQKYLEKNPNGYCHIGKDKFEKARQAKDQSLPSSPSPKAALKDSLTELQYNVTQNAATEPPFNNEFFNIYKPGIYVDVTTGDPLFASTDKFESGCGWPSFSKPISDDSIDKLADNSLGMRRVEVRSKTGNAHLGHVFSDGPIKSGGLRYCINSASLHFIPKDEMEEKGYGRFLPLIN